MGTAIRFKRGTTLKGAGFNGKKVKPAKDPTLLPKKKITPEGAGGINIIPGR